MLPFVFDFLRALALLWIEIVLLASPRSVLEILVLAILKSIFVSFSICSTLYCLLVVFFLALRVRGRAVRVDFGLRFRGT